MESLGLSFWLAAATLLLTIVVTIELLIGNRSVDALRDISPVPGTASKKVSIIVAARNEQRNIRSALQSLLDLVYPNYELIVVDDRSEDATGKILDAMAASTPRLNVIHVDNLPAGWLGKNHALWIGSRRSTGDYLLFTDADIIMEPTIVTRAVTYMERNRLDHLAATPSMQMPTTLLGMFGVSFIAVFSLFSRPWKSKDPKSRYHIGIGAFNMVRSEAYRRVGGHETIRLRPDDDIKLGKIIKKGAFLQGVAYAPEFLAVEWYASITEVIKGLEKNTFSGADYSILMVVIGASSQIICSVWPFAALFRTSGVTWGLNLAIILLSLILYSDCARFHHSRIWYAIGYPLATTLFAVIVMRTMILNLVQGGIYWRGTFYSLKELKTNKV
jgi:glycosyltransferase involved in cell wall biosynthesis